MNNLYQTKKADINFNMLWKVVHHNLYSEEENNFYINSKTCKDLRVFGNVCSSEWARSHIKLLEGKDFCFKRINFANFDLCGYVHRKYLHKVVLCGLKS